MIHNPNLLCNGFYDVNGCAFTSKILACAEGTRQKKHPKWIFNQDCWAKTKWSEEPSETLEELYKQRAIKIREMHDYVVLVWSGGADSTNMLHAFLKNNIKIDEIITQWAIWGSDHYRRPMQDRSAENCVAEWEYCVKPQIKEIEKIDPNIKITIVDTTESLVRCEYKEEDFFMFNSYHNIAGINRWPTFIKALEEIGQKNPNHVLLVGLDKPRFRTKENALYLYFIDVVIHLKSTDKMKIEYFYWHPDSANILRKQAHVVLNYLKGPNRGDQKYVVDGKNYDLRNTIINQLVYPWWDPGIFQSAKQDFLLYNNQQKWIWEIDDYRDGYRNDRWESQYKNLMSAVDGRYYEYRHGVFDGLIGFVTDDYFVGRLDG